MPPGKGRAAGCRRPGQPKLLVVVGSSAAPRLLVGLGRARTLALGMGVIARGNGVRVTWPHEPGIGLAAAVSGLGVGVASVAATDWGTDLDDALQGVARGY